ncbi:hypothetical protein [Streptomyces sp. NPDC050392]|uniref:hypothetical protein n=1 Tax=Streptomyces sp. NPDC050392 TaxID=3155782 RepID=UPI00342822DF
MLDHLHESGAGGDFPGAGRQRVCVGDPAQQIYAWRHAKDIMSGFPGQRLELTQSFRFGPEIAEVANRWLRAAASTMQLTGHTTGPSGLALVEVPDAVLCRGNPDALAKVLTFLDQSVPVGLVGGGKPLLSIAKAAVVLQAVRRTSHHELCLFASWGEEQEYAEQDSAASDLGSGTDFGESSRRVTALSIAGGDHEPEGGSPSSRATSFRNGPRRSAPTTCPSTPSPTASNAIAQLSPPA